jgi:putative hydrolase of the HAD superfamily
VSTAHDSGSIAENLRSAAIRKQRPTANTLFEHWVARFGDAARPFPDVEFVLESLRARGIQMGIITNGYSAMQRATIAALGIEPYMATIVISREVGLSKPDAAIFDHALSAIDCSSSEAWFVADHPDLDVRGAIDAGLRGFWIERGYFEPAPPPAERLRSLQELLDFL